MQKLTSQSEWIARAHAVLPANRVRPHAPWARTSRSHGSGIGAIAPWNDVLRKQRQGHHVRFVASGGEADMYAIRLARAYTGRDKILKFEGGYHGMSAEAQMSLAPTTHVNFPQAVPDSAGIPQSVADQMLIAPFNDLAAVEALLIENKDDHAAFRQFNRRHRQMAYAIRDSLRKPRCGGGRDKNDGSPAPRWQL